MNEIAGRSAERNGWVVAQADAGTGSGLGVAAAGAAAQAVSSHVPALVADRIASRIAAKDATIWGPAAEAESSIRLGWTELHETTRAILPEVAALKAQLDAEGVDRVVLAGMGGSSLAPEVITRTAGVELVVLDSTDPGQVGDALDGDLASTVLVVSSKSGGTVETDSQRRAFETAFAAAGLDPRARIVVVTDPGSPLEKAAREAGYRAVFLADPNVGGRFSALSAFGVVPSALAGADVAALLDEAAAIAPRLAEDSADNPGLVLGAALGGTTPLRNKLIFGDTGSGVVGLGDWAEQLIAESTGKEGRGLLPVVTAPGTEAPELSPLAADAVSVRLAAAGSDPAAQASDLDAEIVVSGPLGAQLLLWEYATAVAGLLLGINPFDQPDVESAKVAARGLLDATPEPTPADLVDDGIEIRATPGLLDGVQDLRGAVGALLGTLDPEHGYLAVLAYLNREASPELAAVREALATRTGRPVTFGWGPRFLHSTGQLHKGGPAEGVFLQITGQSGDDIPIEGRPFTFGQLIAAQATGDAAVLAERGRPVLRLHLTDLGSLDRLTDLLASPSGEEW